MDGHGGFEWDSVGVLFSVISRLAESQWTNIAVVIIMAPKC